MEKRIELEDVMKNINYDLLKLTKKYGNKLISNFMVVSTLKNIIILGILKG